MKKQRDLKIRLSRTIVIVLTGCMLFIMASTITADPHYPPNEYRIPLQDQWNLITVPVNASIAKDQITIRNNSIDYNFTEAVNHGIIVGTFFGWDRENQTYFIANDLGFEPGNGYWLWAYYPCSLIIHSDVRGDGYITNLLSQWNMMGQTYNSSLALTNLRVLYNGTSYSWANATTANNEEGHPLLIGFIFKWDGTNQWYDLSTGFTPGEGYWMYAYHNCSLRQVIDAPVIIDNSADTAGTGNSYVCNASVSDSDGVTSVWLEYWYAVSPHSFVQMNPTGVNNYYEKLLTIPSASVDSLHYIIVANDTKNHWDTTGEQIVVVTDDDAPVIANVLADPSSTLQGGSINISCDVTDNIAVHKVQVNITYPDLSSMNLSMEKGTGYYLNRSYTMGGTYEFFIWTNDTSNHSNKSSVHTFTINFTDTYTLTITKSGTGLGTVETNNTGPYYYGAKITLWANASSGSLLTRWNGALSGTTTPQTLIMDANKSVDAEFTLMGPQGWIYYKKITVNHSLIDGILTNFPILVSTTDTNLTTHAQPGARDVQFWDATNTTRYHHEIEKYNDTTGEFIAWVNITHLSATQDTIIWMRYGNTTCGSQENVAGTWDGNYVMVQHLNETGNTLYDSTSYSNNGVSTGTDFTATGEIDGARQYNDNDKIVANNFTHSPNALTAEAWIYRDATAFIYISCKGTYSTSNDWILYLRNNQTPANQGIDFSIKNHTSYIRKGDTPVNRWFYLTATYNSGTATLYFNGTQIGYRTGWPSIPNTYPHLGVGNDYLGTNGGENPMTQVKFDEFRVSKIARNSSWIRTSYNTMSQPASFIHIGVEEEIQYTLSITTSGTGSGTIEVQPSGPYYYGAIVKLWANASVGSLFTGWTGALTGTITPQTLVMDTYKTVDAAFRFNGPMTLTITKSGSGSGTVETNISGPFSYGAVVKLWANASSGSTFAGWSGALSGTITPQTLTMDANKNVDAHFIFNGPYIFTITKSGTGSGTVERNTTGPYYYGAKVKLWANASINSTFMGWSGALNGTTTPQTLMMDANKSVDARFNDTMSPTIGLNFAGNPSDSGGPYYLPGTNTPAPEGYYTNASYQKEKWIQIKCTATDNVGIDQVWLHWRNGSQWTNNTYQLTHTTGNYYGINMSTNIAPGPKYSFDLLAVDTSGNTMLYRWLKIGADTTAVDDRRYVQLGGTPTNISYTPYYFYPAQYKYTTGYGPGHNMTNDDTLHHDQGPDGTLTDSGYLLNSLPTNVVQERYCTMYVGYWFDETVTPQSGTIRNIYHHFWWQTNNHNLTVAYGKSDAGFYRTEAWGQSYPTNTTKARTNIIYNSLTYYLESALMKISSPQSFTDNDIYEFFVEYYTSSTTNPSIINNRSIQSFVIFNVPDNTTLQGQDTDADGLTDYQELYGTFTNPFVQDTDNDGFNDYIEYVCGSNPNNYKAIPTSYPVFSAESPQNQSIAQPLNPSLSITVGQAQSYLMNVTFRTNATGSWQTIGTNHSVLNGRYSQTPTTMNNYSTTYYWSVQCNAGTLWTNKTYSYTTQAAPINNPPIVTSPNPANMSTNMPPTLSSLSVTIQDPEGDHFNWIIKGQYVINASQTGDGNGTKTASLITPLPANTTIKWHVNVTDSSGSKKWTNKTYSFTTKSIIPTRKWLITSASGVSRVGPSVADVNNDGWIEVIRSGENGIVVYNGTTGAVVWTRSMVMLEYHYPLEVIDLNKDGILEIICSYDTGTMALYGNNGSVYWYNPDAPLYDKHPVAGDINADGYPEVYVCNSGSSDGSSLGSITALTHDGKIFASTSTYYPCYGGLSLGDTNYDGVFELYLNERNYGYSGNTVGKGVRALWASNLTERWSHPEMLSSSHCPTLVDVNKDGILDVVSLHQGGGIAVFNSADGSVIHESLSIPGLQCHSQPTIYDIDGDGNLELMACREGSKPIVWDLYTWQKETGGLLDSYGRLPYKCWEPPAIADINGDGFVEILACTQQNISIFDHHYQFIGSIPLACYDYYGTAMIVAQDIDHDGLTELVINLNNQLLTYDTIATAPNPRALSQFMYYSPMRGRSPYYVPYGPLIPIVKNEAPTNRSTNQQTNPTLSVYFYDYQHDSMTISFKTNASTGVWHTITSFVNVHDGTYTASTTEMNTNDTTYWWSVIVTDYTGKSISKVYKFMTVGRHILTNPSPMDDATGVELNPVLSVHVEDRQGSPITILFKTNASGVWVLIGSNTSVGNGTYRQKPTTMNTYSSKYFWSVNCTNGIVWTNQSYQFTTFTPSTTSWWNPAWMYRKEIIVDHTKVYGNLNNFPLLINLSTDTSLAAHAQPDGDDIVFTDAQGNKLNHEIELYTSATGRLVAWVNVTRLSSITDTKLYLYYGNALCSSQQNPQGTWNAEYLMVHHMNETGNIIDSTSHALNAVNYGTTTELNGKIDGCRYFDSNNDRYDFGAPVALNPGMSSWTISLWTKTSYVNDTNILQKWGSNAGFYLKMYNNGAGGYNYFDVSDGIKNTFRYWDTIWSDGNWHYLTMVINRNTNQIDVYLDGTLHNGPGTGNVAGFGSITTTSNLNFYGGTNGRHDEFSISTTVRNTSWIKTCYNNQNDPASFYRIYPEQPVPPLPPSVTNPQPTDGATNLALHPTLRITVSHNYSYLMNIIWKTNASGIWTVIGTNNSVSNGVYSCSYTAWASQYHKKYWWRVEVNDGHGHWNNKTYSFTTITMPPTQGTPLLVSEYGTNTTNEDLICSNQSTMDPNGLDVYNTYHWLRNSNSLTNLQLSFNTENQTSVKDYSGYNNNGIISGASWNPNGVIGGVYHFSGVDSDDYISIPHSTTLDGGGTWTAMTVEHWIYLTGDQINSRTIAKMATSGNQRSYQIGFQSSTPDNRLLAGVYIGSDNYIEVTYDTPLQTGVWYHVALTYKSGTGVKLYVNGVAVSTIAGTGNIQASTGNNLYIGCRYGTQGFFDGSIDEVKIYPYALTTEQIYQNYLESKDGLSTNSTIVPEETNEGDVWQCDVTPSNGVLDGLTKASNPLTIVSSGHTLVIHTMGNGIVAKNPDYTTYPSDTVVNLTAAPDAGWFFSYWSGDLTGNTNQTSITMDANKNITATFIDISGTTTAMTDIDSGLTSPTGNYRWRDIANQNYSENYRNSYNYTQANVEVTYYTVESTLHGYLNAVNLKPNFAYQLKLVGTPGTPDNERIGLVGRWWQEEWNGTAWTNGQNLNNKGNGSSPNPNDNNYSARKDIPDATGPTGLHYRFTGYLVFDYFITDEAGNTTFTFEANSSYHVLWKTSQQGRTDDDGPLKSRTFDANLSSPAYDVDYPLQTVSLFGEWERLPMGGVPLSPGEYVAQLMLTEESFHGIGLYDGNWAAAMSANIQCTIVDIE